LSDLAGQSIGPYRLVEHIGQGGMAAVYRAVDTRDDRVLAVKILTATAAAEPELVQRFLREAELLTRLRHPNLVPVEDFGETDGHMYLVMPLYGAGSLNDRLQRGAMTPQEGSQLIAQVSSALDYAHGQGIVHRDIKPSNILLDDQGNALLSDFGLARVADASVSLTGSCIVGTPAYIAPEQVRGEAIDPRTDQYSLGIVLYQLTTGKLPFESDSPMAVLLKHVNEPLPRPRSVAPSIPESVEQVILKATAKDPKDRFASVAEMNDAFRAALDHALHPEKGAAPQIHLGPSSALVQPVPIPRSARPSSRRRLLVAGLVALVALLVLAFPTAVLDLLTGASGRAEGSSSTIVIESGPQLTAMARTLQALGTEIVAARSDSLGPGEIQTAVAQTMAVLMSSQTGIAVASDTPAVTLAATPTPSGSPPATGTRRPPTGTSQSTRTAAGGQSPTPSATPSQTPTATQTPTSTRTLAPTQSRTATPSRTASVTATGPGSLSPTPSRTPSPTPTPQPTLTTIPTRTSTSTATPVSTPVPSETSNAIPTIVAPPTTPGGGGGGGGGSTG
jgi:serine/threonine protein kinase